VFVSESNLIARINPVLDYNKTGGRCPNEKDKSFLFPTVIVILL
jgi:hypothetical protein